MFTYISNIIVIFYFLKKLITYLNILYMLCVSDLTSNFRIAVLFVILDGQTVLKFSFICDVFVQEN
jgi:hypothetical protein